MLGDSLTDMGHAIVEQKDTLQVKVKSYKTFDTANCSPLGEPRPPAAEGATLSSPATANSLLDKLLAKTATMQQKLAGMTQSGQISHLETATRPPFQLARGTASPLVGTPSPGAILDSCLARACTLNVKMDKLSAEVSARQDPIHPTLPADTDQPGGQGSYDKASNLELARDTSATRKAEKQSKTTWNTAYCLPR